MGSKGVFVTRHRDAVFVTLDSGIKDMFYFYSHVSSPEPPGSQGELIVYPCSGVPKIDILNKRLNITVNRAMQYAAIFIVSKNYEKFRY